MLLGATVAGVTGVKGVFGVFVEEGIVLNLGLGVGEIDDLTGAAAAAGEFEYDGLEVGAGDEAGEFAAFSAAASLFFLMISENPPPPPPPPLLTKGEPCCLEAN